MKTKDENLPKTTPIINPTKNVTTEQVVYDLVASPPLAIVNERYQRMIRDQARGASGWKKG